MAKAQLEELGEDTDGLADSVSSLREEILALAGVDIMIDDNTFKDTYDIMLELSRVWDKLSDVSQAALLEKIAGKRGANAVASILSNVHDLEAAYATAQNSAGSAAAENLKYLESIEGKLKQLEASWQEFWDSSILSGAIKAGIDGINLLVQALNKLGGMDFAVTLAGIVAITQAIKRLGGLTKNVTALFEAFSDLKSLMKSKNMGWTDIFKGNFITKKQLEQNVDNVVGSALATYNSIYNAAGGVGDAAARAGNAALLDLAKNSGILSESTEDLTRSLIERAKQQETNIDLDQQEAVKLEALKNEMRNGGAESQKFASAQSALKGALAALAAAGISFAINAISNYIRKQDELRQKIIENGKTQVKQAQDLRDAAANFDKVNNEYKAGEASSDDLRNAVENVNTALGDQKNLLEGLTAGSEAWRKKLEEVIKAQNDVAQNAAMSALYASSKQSSSEWLTKYGIYAGKNTLGSLNPLFGLVNAMSDFGLPIGGKDPISQIVNKLNEVEDLTERSNQIKYLKQWQDELKNLQEEYDKLEKEQADAFTNSDGKTGNIFTRLFGKDYDKELEKNRERQQEIKKLIGQYSQSAQEALDAAAYLVWEDSLKDIDSAADMYVTLDKAIQDVIKTFNLGEDAAEGIRQALIRLIPEAAEAINLQEAAEKAAQNRYTRKFSADEYLAAVDEGVLTEDDIRNLTDSNFIEYLDRAVKENGLYIKSIKDVAEALSDWDEETKRLQRETNTLTGVVAANKEAIDAAQDAISKLGSIFTADYSNNASGMIDDLQELVDILGTLDAKEAEKFFDQLNNSFSMESLGDAMKDVSEDLMDLQIDKIVDQLNVLNPAVEEAFRAMVKQQKQVETLTADLDSFKSSYQSLTSVIKDYNENGFLTASNIESLLSMSPEYLSALEFEGNKLRLNKEALKDIVLARLEEAKQQVESTYQTKLAAIAAEQEARTKKVATAMTYEYAMAQLKAAIAAGESEAAIMQLEKQVYKLYEAEQKAAGVNVDTSGFDETSRKQAEAAKAARDASIKSIEDVQKAVAEGRLETLDTFLDIEEGAKDAANELKSQIDSVLSKWKSALDSGAINYKQYLDKMKAMRDKYADQLSQEDLLQMDVDIAQTEVDMWKEAGDALGRQIDRTMIKPIQDRIEGLNDEREALQKNKEATSAYYDEIIGGLEDQKQAIDDNIKAVEKSYDAQIKPLEAQQKEINKQVKAIEKEKRVIEDQIKALERSKRPYEQQQKAIQKEIKAIEKEIQALEKSKKPYEQKQKAIDKEIKAVEREVRALERTKKPYEQQQKVIEKEIKAIEKQIKALEKTKKPYEDQKKAIDKQVKAIQNQIKAIEDSKRPY